MKISKTLILAIGIIVIAGVMFSGCHSSGGGSGSTQPTTKATTLSGTAAAGAPIASATITLKDMYGALKTIDTGTDGKYVVDVTGMTAPFLLKITSGATTLYSTATATGTANIHPFADLIIRNWYKVQGSDIDTDFGGTGALLLPPTTSEIATIEAVIRNILSAWLTNVGLSATDFNLLNSSFDANGEGFDKILDNMKVTIDTTGQVVITSTDPTTGIGGTSISTNIINLATTDTTAPTVPSGLNALAANAGQVVLFWNSSTDNVGIAGYSIYRDGSLIGTSPFPVYIDSGLAAASYCYQVEAFDGAGNISINKSAEACVTALAAVDTSAPTVPGGLTVTAGPSGNISLSWTDSTDDTAVLGYKIFRGTTEIATITSTSYNDTDLTAGTNYCYTVKAVDTALNISSASAPACASTLALSIPVTTVWKSSFAGTVFNKTPTIDTTYIAMVMTQSGSSVSGTIGYQDTLGRSGTTNFTGSINGTSITTQYTDFDSSCASRTNTLTGTVGSSSMTLLASALSGGSCAAFSGYEMTFALATPTTYMASGTYAYLSSSSTLTLNTLSSTFTGERALNIGSTLKTGVTVSATTLTWDNANSPVTWRRGSGTANDIKGTWTAVNPSGNSLQFTFNANGTFSHIGNIVMSAYGNPWAFSQYWTKGYAVHPAYGDPTKTATSVVVTGPGITSSLSLIYDTTCGGAGGCWDLSGFPVQFGTTHPTPPITYTFTIQDALTLTTKTATVAIGCFMESLPSNLAVYPFSGNLTFTWTRAYPANQYPNLKYHVQISDSTYKIVWNSPSVIDADTITYTSPTLTPGALYNITLIADAFELDCSSSVMTTYTY